MNGDLKAVWDEIKEIKDNHLAHLKGDIGDLKVSMAELNTNQKWLMRAFWLVAAGVITLLIKSFI